jgi:hypothetical protein
MEPAEAQRGELQPEPEPAGMSFPPPPRTKTFNAEALAKYRAAPVCGGMVAKPTLAWSLAMTTAVVGTRPSSATRGHPMPDLLLPPWTPTYNLSQSTMTQVTLHAV